MTIDIKAKGEVMLPDSFPLVRRGPHRSTKFMMMFDVGDLIDERGRPRVSDDDLEELIFEQCRKAVQGALSDARHKVRGHP